VVAGNNDDTFWANQVENLRTALEAAEQVRVMAEENYRRALEALKEVARLLMPDVIREATEAGRDLGPKDLVEAARAQTAMLKVYRASSGNARREDLEQEAARLRAEVARLRPYEEQARALEIERNALRERLHATEGTVSVQVETINNLREQVRDLRRQLAEALAGQRPQAQPSPPQEQPKAEEPVATAPVTSVIEQSKARTNAPDKALPPDDPAWAIVKAMGETGLCLRDEIAHAAGVGDAKWGTVREMFKRLRDAGLIQEERPAVESVGRTPFLVSLTETGKATFCRRFGHEPAPSIFARLLARHKSVDHAWLNLQAARTLKARGYDVDLFPREQSVDGSTFAPDLIAAKDGQVFYIECERETRKHPGERARKWEIYHHATGGQFYIVVPNKATQSAILSEIGRWVYEHGKPVTVHMCTLALLREHDDVWVLKREIRRR
jgi:hypothetical protein